MPRLATCADTRWLARRARARRRVSRHDRPRRVAAGDLARNGRGNAERDLASLTELAHSLDGSHPAPVATRENRVGRALVQVATRAGPSIIPRADRSAIAELGRNRRTDGVICIARRASRDVIAVNRQAVGILQPTAYQIPQCCVEFYQRGAATSVVATSWKNRPGSAA